MPRAQANKLYRTFVKGLITEAGPLTYPEDATTDESNCVLNLGGYRSRRLGINIEAGGIGYTNTTIPSELVAVNEFLWKNPANRPDLNFTVVQVGNMITFTNNAARPMSTTVHPFSINLTFYDAFGFGGITENYCQFASGKGVLFIVHPRTDPLMVTYLPDTNSFEVTTINIAIRDMTGLDDELTNDEEPTTLSNTHQYNLQNQGWVDSFNDATGPSIKTITGFQKFLIRPQATVSVINAYFAAHARYPGNNKVWWMAKDSTTADFDPELLNKFFLGSSRVPRGHYILNAFDKDREAASAVSGIPIEKTWARPSCVAFANGRAWYGLGSSIYFSQIMDHKTKAGNCYQEADPTAEDISDLIATDGGVIEIPEMSSINRLLPLGEGMLCFSPNGVWFIAGGQGGFSATDFSISKISPTGTEAPMSVVHVQDANTDMVMYWSRVGIIGLQERQGQFGKIDGKFDSSILTQSTIQTFYNRINTYYHQFVKSHYDTSTNTVQWLYNSGACPYYREFDAVLNFDLTLKAFYPWKTSAINPTDGPYLVGVFETVTNTGLRNAFSKYLTSYHQSGTIFYSMGEENNTSFKDWDSVPYPSFLETGYELLEDAMRDKQAMYVFTYLKRTETAYVPVGGGDYTVDKPSSLTMTTKWDWANSSVANRWSSPVECYRHTRIPMHDPAVSNVFDTGFPIVVTKHKVRGHGKAIQFRFENNAIGKDFVLYGWSVPFSGNTNP